MNSLSEVLPVQSHYYLLRLKKPGGHGPYAFFGGSVEGPGLLVFPLLEKAEQFCMTVAKGHGKPERVSAETFLKLVEKAGAISLADGLRVTVAKICPQQKDKS